MDREIKFLSWDEEKQCLIGPWKIGSVAAEIYTPDFQYTGMKDTNNIEIFEGHIVECIYILYNSDSIGIVKMKDGCWCVDFTFSEPDKRPWCPDVQMKRNFDYVKMFLPVMHNKIEIIGHIKTHKELLK